MRPAGYLLIALSTLTGSWLLAAEPTPAQKTTQSAATDKDAATNAAEKAADQDKKSADAKAGEEGTAADKASSEKKSGGKASPQRFIPSEQVRADFDVSFPVDI